MRILVTGGAGFIGSAFVRRRLAATDDEIVVLDKLTYAGNRANLAECEADPALAKRLDFVVGDICDPIVVNSLVERVDAVINFAAESHVDRSILDAEAFLRTGVIGVHVLLDAVLRESARRPVRYLQVSTDEVYGAVEEGYSVEDDNIEPRSPYAAAKAAGELLVKAYFVTHGRDVVTTRGANTYGPYQHPEKVIPLFVTNAIEDQPLPMYGDGRQQRDWLHVNDHADAVGFVLDHGASGETYNVAGTGLRMNREIATVIIEQLGKDWSLVRSVPDRPGHDRRYAMDGSKLTALGWTATVELEPGLRDTIDWFVENKAWWRQVKSGDWAAYYNNQYAHRLAESVEGVNTARPVAVTGAQGRLGRAIVDALRAAGTPVVAWTRPDYDLDDPAAAERVVARDLPSLIVHCAAWTDVDGCAREPELAMRRNATAVGELAAAAAQRGIGLAGISTNEVFDGERTDGRAYAEDDKLAPINPYGSSKALGERLAADAFSHATTSLWTVRTAWLYGPPGADFPNKILAAADRLPPGDALGVVSDEVGSPTYTLDLADAVVRLVAAAPGGVYHLANSGTASRFDIARAVLARCRPDRTLKPISRTAFSRASNPPAWAVLDVYRASTYGVTLRPWSEALAEYADQIC